MNRHHKTHDIQLKNVNEIHRTVHAILEMISTANQSCITIYHTWNNSDLDNAEGVPWKDLSNVVNVM